MTTDRPTLAAVDQAYSAYGRAVVARNELAAEVADQVADGGSSMSAQVDLAALTVRYRRARTAATEAYQAYSDAIQADIAAAGS